MARGPAPTPTAKLAPGSWRRPSRKKAGEPAPLTTRFYCPRWLSREGKEVWHRIKGQLKEAGVLSTTDENALARYAATFASWLEAERVLVKEGPTMPKYAIVKKTGEAVEIGYEDRPEVTRSLRLASELDRLEAKLGLTPADRTRVKTTTKKRPVKPKGGFKFDEVEKKKA